MRFQSPFLGAGSEAARELEDEEGVMATGARATGRTGTSTELRRPMLSRLVFSSGFAGGRCHARCILDGGRWRAATRSA